MTAKVQFCGSADTEVSYSIDNKDADTTLEFPWVYGYPDVLIVDTTNCPDVQLRLLEFGQAQPKYLEFTRKIQTVEEL